MTGDGAWVRTRDGSWALVVRPLPGLTAVAVLVAGLGLWLMFEAEQERRGGGTMELTAMVVVTLATAVALVRTTPFPALFAAMLAAAYCALIKFNYNYYPAPDVRLPWRPYLIASAGLVVLAGLLSMLAAFRTVGASASATLQARLAGVAAYRGTTPNLLGRSLVAVAAGGIGMVVAGAGVRHAWNSRYAVPPVVVAGLAVMFVLVSWLLVGNTATRLAERGLTPFLVPALVALAGLVIAPLAVIRLWSYQRPRPFGPPEAASVIPERIWFDPEAGGLGVLAGCLLMVTAAGMLLARHAITGLRHGRR